MIKYIIIIVLIILILNNIKTQENFTDFNPKAYLETQIDNYYDQKIKNINNILDFVKSYNNNNNNINITSSTPINCNNMTINKDVEIKGYNKFNNLIIDGDLTISDNLIIDDYRNDTYTKDINIIPRYMIIAWYNKYKLNNDEIIELDIPKGWALCDGKKYVNINNNIIEWNNSITEYTDEIIETPNLINKFIIGASKEDITWTSSIDARGKLNTAQTSSKKILNSFGGNNDLILTESQLPPHSHLFTIGPKIVEDIDKKSHGVYSHNMKGSGNKMMTKLDYYGQTNPKPIDIRPPYYTLYYIMKL